MAIAGRVMTADDLWRRPNDGCRHELLRGELRTMTPAGFEHGAIVVNITAPLAEHVKSQRLGDVCGAETGFKIAVDPDTVLAPDAAFVRRERIAASGRPIGFWPGAPDLAVEVLSPSDTVYAVDEKVEAWLSAGSTAVWIVNPHRRTVTIHRSGTAVRTLSGADTLEGEDVVPGFRVPVADIFAS